MVKILYITFYFYPYSHPGGQRALKQVKYLQKNDIHPIVLHCSNMPWKDFDQESYEKEVVGKMDVLPITAPRFNKNRTLIDRAVLRFESVLFEDRADWALGNLDKVAQMVDDRKIDMALTSGPPQSVHILGWYLKEKKNLPWIMDMRDPFVIDPKCHGLVEFIQKKLLFEIYERIFIKSADCIVATSEETTLRLSDGQPESREKFHTVRNGFDEDDFRNTVPNRLDRSRMNIVYTGRFWGDRTPHHFFEGLRMAVSLKPGLRNTIRIILVGAFGQDIAALVHSKGLSDLVTIVGLVSHREALSLQVGSDANLLIVDSMPGVDNTPFIPGKLPEYIRAGRPIIAVAPRGEARTLIEKYQLGVTVSPDDRRGIAEVLLSIAEKWKKKELAANQPDPALLEQFDRAFQTLKLSRIMKDLIKKGSSE